VGHGECSTSLGGGSIKKIGHLLLSQITGHSQGPNLITLSVSSHRVQLAMREMLQPTSVQKQPLESVAFSIRLLYTWLPRLNARLVVLREIRTARNIREASLCRTEGTWLSYVSRFQEWS
jgi:hypothetical protein